MPTQLFQGRIQHVSGALNHGYNDFESMTAPQSINNPGGTLSGEDNNGDSSLAGARFLMR